MILSQWAARHGISPQALAELRGLMGVLDTPVSTASGKSEAVAQQQVRLEAPRRGVRLWRNNVGAAFDRDGRPVRFGLANDSKALNKKIKSSDLIGITPCTIGPEDIGRVLGIFTSYETKRQGWHYTGTPREQAQLAWHELVLSFGGLSKFVTGPDDLY